MSYFGAKNTRGSTCIECFRCTFFELKTFTRIDLVRSLPFIDMFKPFSEVHCNRKCISDNTPLNTSLG